MPIFATKKTYKNHGMHRCTSKNGSQKISKILGKSMSQMNKHNFLKHPIGYEKPQASPKYG